MLKEHILRSGKRSRDLDDKTLASGNFVKLFSLTFVIYVLVILWACHSITPSEIIIIPSEF